MTINEAIDVAKLDYELFPEDNEHLLVLIETAEEYNRLQDLMKEKQNDR